MPSHNPTAAAGRLISELGHELKAPLTLIRGFAELLETRDDEASRREATARILEGSRRLSDSIDELLAAFVADPELARRLAEARAKRAPTTR